MANLRFIITGGPGAGKTTTLEALAERGYYYVPEVARAIIRQPNTFLTCFPYQPENSFSGLCFGLFSVDKNIVGERVKPELPGRWPGNVIRTVAAFTLQDMV
jgi:predicted ATPase